MLWAEGCSLGVHGALQMELASLSVFSLSLSFALAFACACVRVRAPASGASAGWACEPFKGVQNTRLP